MSVDFDDGDPLPLAGLWSNAGQIALIGSHGSDTLVTTGNVATVGSDLIQFSSGTVISDQLATSGGVIGLRGTTFVSLPFNGSTAQPATVLPGATVIVSGSTKVSTLTIDPGGTFRMAESGASLITVGTLDIEGEDAAGDNGGVLDLSDNDMIASNTAASAIFELLAAGYDGRVWDGIAEVTGPRPGCVLSSAAAADPNFIHAIGYEQVGSASGDWSPTDLFDGEAVASGDAVLKYAVYGDANLDGSVDSSDETRINDGASYALSGWGNGDFCYHGFVDDDSYALFAAGASYSGGVVYTATTDINKTTISLIPPVVARTSKSRDSIHVTPNPGESKPASAAVIQVIQVKQPDSADEIIDPEKFSLDASAFADNGTFYIDANNTLAAGDYDVVIQLKDSDGNKDGTITVRVTLTND